MTYAATVLADSPLAYWRLGEPSGTTMTDSSGNSRNGTYAGSPTLGTTGLLTGDSDTAVTFTGVKTKYGSVTYAAWMDVSTLTLEALVKPAAIGTTMSILDRDNQGSIRILEFRIEISGKLGVLLWDSGGTLHALTGTTVLSAGSVYHVAATWDGTTITLYINGVSDGTLSVTGTMKTGSYGFGVGVSDYTGNVSGPYQPFNGVVDEAAYYGSALSSTRIAAHYTAATTGGGGSTPRGPFRLPDALRRQAVTRASSY